MKIEQFEDIEAWQKARDLTKMIYKISSESAFSRDFGLGNQIRKASVSILSNIAEGFERGGNREFLQFLAMARGSCGEVRTQLYVALDQQYISKEEFDLVVGKTIEVSRMISGLMRYLQRSKMRGNKYK